MKYRKKPIVIEAYKLGSGELPEWLSSIELDQDGAYIETLEGIMRAKKGDYIIRGIRGELYPCRADIFEETYERV